MTTRPVHVRYFAILREQRGRDAETIATAAPTAADFYRELQGRHGFTLPAERLRVAINDRFAPWDSPLAANDNVVFIPPVAGG